MFDYIPELLALTEIMLEQKNYREALFKASMEEKLSSRGKKRLQEIVYGVLRHYFNLSFECLNLLPYGKDSEEHLLALIALFELRYHKETPVEEIKRAYYDAFLKERLLGDKEDNFKALENASLTPFKIPSEVKEAPFVYNSLVLELPDFLLRRFAKDFSPKVALSIAAYLHKRPLQFYAPIYDEEKQAKLLASDDFENISFEDNSFLYRGNKVLSLKECLAKGIYPITYTESLAYSRLNVPQIKPKILLTGVLDGAQILPLTLRTLDLYESEVSAAFANPISYRSGADMMKKYQLKNAKLINCNINMIKTYRSFDQYDVVVSMGNDLQIGMARKNPAILPSLKEKSFLKSKNRQVADLLEVSSFVKPGGQLLFINHALDKEETSEVIAKFLSQRKEFHIVEKEIVFPSRMDSDGGFYAILERKTNNHD